MSLDVTTPWCVVNNSVLTFIVKTQIYHCMNNCKHILIEYMKIKYSVILKALNPSQKESGKTFVRQKLKHHAF
jgi:hypothetical protein